MPAINADMHVRRFPRTDLRALGWWVGNYPNAHGLNARRGEI